jgi:hypothetical protein
MQARLGPSPVMQRVPQLRAFHADRKTNVGTNPAPGFREEDECGFGAMAGVVQFALQLVRDIVAALHAAGRQAAAPIHDIRLDPAETAAAGTDHRP